MFVPYYVQARTHGGSATAAPGALRSGVSIAHKGVNSSN